MPTLPPDDRHTKHARAHAAAGSPHCCAPASSSRARRTWAAASPSATSSAWRAAPPSAPTASRSTSRGTHCSRQAHAGPPLSFPPRPPARPWPFITSDPHIIYAHDGQVRRYVYHNVIKQAELAGHVDVGGAQPYVINGARVLFLDRRPQQKPRLPLLPAGAAPVNVCQGCERTLQEPYSFCSLACKARCADAVLLGCRVLQSDHNLCSLLRANRAPPPLPRARGRRWMSPGSCCRRGAGRRRQSCRSIRPRRPAIAGVRASRQAAGRRPLES